MISKVELKAKKLMSNELITYAPLHLGYVLKDELQARGINQKRFSVSMLNEITNDKRPISAEMSLVLEATLDINALFWNNVKSRYNLEMARRNKDNIEKLETIGRRYTSVIL